MARCSRLVIFTSRNLFSARRQVTCEMFISNPKTTHDEKRGFARTFACLQLWILVQSERVFTSLNKRVIRKWSEWSKRGSACSQSLNKKLVEASCAKRGIHKSEYKLHRLITKRGFACSQVWIKSFKVSSAKRMFTSLNKKLVEWSTRSFACSQSLNSRVSRETPNQTGVMRGSCIRRLQSWRRNCWHRRRCCVEI